MGSDCCSNHTKHTSRAASSNRKLWWSRIFNVVFPIWTVSGLTSGVYCGLFIALPEIYSHYNQPTLHFIASATITISVIQTLLSLYKLRTVTSYFNPSLLSKEEMERLINESDKKVVKMELPSNTKLPETGAVSDRLQTIRGQRYFPVYKPSSDGRKIVHLYPFMSWRPCYKCGVSRPPRSHHCPLCERCILKRDHHCFFSGSCVGLHNQRYFLSFISWAFLLLIVALSHALFYLFFFLWPSLASWDLLLPVCIVNWLLGYTTNMNILMMCVLYTLLTFTPLCRSFFNSHLTLIREGKLEFEKSNKLKIVDSRSHMQKIQAVLGRRWWLPLLFPLLTWDPVLDDGINWPTIKHTE